MTGICVKDGCTRTATARQMCSNHYNRWWSAQTHGEPPTPEAVIAEMRAAYDEAVSE